MLTPLDQTDSVTYKRFGLGTKSPDGFRATGAVEAGFPKTVLGSWQGQSDVEFVDAVGLTRKAEATFYASDYHDGRPGDQVTFGSIVMWVVAARRVSSLDDATPDHTEYALASVKSGGAA